LNSTDSRPKNSGFLKGFAAFSKTGPFVAKKHYAAPEKPYKPGGNEAVNGAASGSPPTADKRS
jgi:hypothetical protein